jgi:hypothetical protein
MAFAARRRRRRTPWWLLFGILLTLVVLLVNAAVGARSKAPSRRLAELAYLDQVRPFVERSTDEGSELRQVRTDAAKLGRVGVNRSMDRIHTDADAVLRAVQATSPPSSLGAAHSLLVATLALRSHAVTTVQAALVQALGTDPPSGAIAAMVDAGRDLDAADRSYSVFVDSLPPGVRGQAGAMPPSKWVDDPTGWDEADLTVFVGSLRSASALAPVHDVSVILFTTDPAAVGTENGAAVLPVVKTLRVQIVVGNAGNEVEKHVTVTATVTPGPGVGGQAETVRDFVDLAPGQRQVVTLGGLHAAPGGSSTLTVAIAQVAGETTTADNSKSLTFVVH